MGLGQTLHFAEAGVEGHGGVGGILGHVEVGGATQLFLDHQRLLQQLRRGGRRKRQINRAALKTLRNTTGRNSCTSKSGNYTQLVLIMERNESPRWQPHCRGSGPSGTQHFLMNRFEGFNQEGGVLERGASYKHSVANCKCCKSSDPSSNYMFISPCQVWK